MPKQQQSPFLILGLALGAVALILGALGGYYQHMNARFAAEGRQTTGTVLVKKVEKNTDADDRYLLQLGYTDQQQKAQSGWEAVPKAAWDGLKEGQSLPVLYLPNAPTTVRLDQPGLESSGTGYLTVAAVLGLVAVASLFAWVRTRKRQAV